MWPAYPGSRLWRQISIYMYVILHVLRANMLKYYSLCGRHCYIVNRVRHRIFGNCFYHHFWECWHSDLPWQAKWAASVMLGGIWGSAGDWIWKWHISLVCGISFKASLSSRSVQLPWYTLSVGYLWLCTILLDVLMFNMKTFEFWIWIWFNLEYVIKLLYSCYVMIETE